MVNGPRLHFGIKTFGKGLVRIRMRELGDKETGIAGQFAKYLIKWSRYNQLGGDRWQDQTHGAATKRTSTRSTGTK
jgi:hypothetical protein